MSYEATIPSYMKPGSGWRTGPDPYRKTKVKTVIAAIRYAGRPLTAPEIMTITKLYDYETRAAIQSGLLSRQLLRVARGLFRVAGEA